MISETCAFETDRLIVKPWHAVPGDEWPKLDLAAVVAEMMTEPVTRYLPEGWQGPYSLHRAGAWVTEQDNESPMLLVIERQSREPAGLVILFESPAIPHDLLDIRVGYLLAETAWGKGLATELISGLIRWCRNQPTIGSITAGVDPTNEPSRRVLERLGFSSIDASNSDPDNELDYQLQVSNR